MRNKKRSSNKSSAGFTMVELMISILISTLVMIAVYSAYTVQQGTYRAQDQVAKMQQNLRAAVAILGADIKMAGYDPTFNGSGVRQFGVTSAASDQFVFTIDEDSDGVVDGGETFTIALYVTGDGVNAVRRFAGGSAVANHIEAIEFQYLDAAGAVLTAPVSAANIPNIRAVRMSLLARAAQPDPKFTNNMTYTGGSGTLLDLNGTATGTGNPANDNFRRRLLITTINCRNLGV